MSQPGDVHREHLLGFVLLGLNVAVAALNVDMLTFNAALAAVLVPQILVLYVIGTRTFNRESLIKSL